MSTTGDVKITEGSGKNVATYTISEDSETKSLQRIVLCDPTGAEIGSAISTNATSTAPSPVELGPFVTKTVAASVTLGVLGATGAVGDYLYGFHIQPTSTTAGAVTIYDGSSTVVYSYPGGTVGADLRPVASLVIAAKCANAGWHVTTGAGVTVTAIGTFT